MSHTVYLAPGMLSDNAHTLFCATLRRNILAVMEAPLFTRYERVKAKLNTVQCHEAAQLQRWYAGVHAERQRREAAGQRTTAIDAAGWEREQDAAGLIF